MATLIQPQNGVSSFVRLVLLEDGARLPRSVQSSLGEDGELVVVAQSADESGSEFALRAFDRIEALEKRHKRALEAVLAVGPHQAGADRADAAHALLQHLLSAGRGTLLISAGSEAGERQAELLTLAGNLMAELGGTRIFVRVRFEHDDDVEAQSGVRWKLGASRFPIDLCD